MTKFLLLASATVGIAALPLGAAQAQVPMDWSGLYAGLHAGYLSGDAHVNYEGSPGGGNVTGFIGGGLIGYNFASSAHPPWVFGVEADFGLGDVGGTGIVVCDLCVDYRYDLEWDAHFLFRAGLPMGHVMPFIAGGLALADLSVTSDEVVGGIYVGGTIGGGVDVKLGSGPIARVEALYDRYARKSYEEISVNFSAWTVRAALIFMLP